MGCKICEVDCKEDEVESMSCKALEVEEEEILLDCEEFEVDCEGG